MYIFLFYFLISCYFIFLFSPLLSPNDFFFLFSPLLSLYDNLQVPSLHWPLTRPCGQILPPPYSWHLFLSNVVVATPCVTGTLITSALDYFVLVVSGGVRTFFTSAPVADVTVRTHTDIVTLQAPSFPDTVGVMWECCLFVGSNLKSKGEKNIF